MNKRTRLRDVQLVGVRSWIRRSYFGLTIALAAIGFAGYLLPAHRVDGRAWHSNFADGGPWPLLVFAALAAIAVVLRQRGLGAGIALGVLSTAAAMASVLPVILVHLLGDVQEGVGEYLYAASVIGLFFGGLFAIVEPILYLTQRRANERAARLALPALPIARIYR